MNNEIENPEVHLIKFISGEEIVAEILESTETSLRIRNPFVVNLLIDAEEGNQTMVLFPWLSQALFKTPTQLKIQNLSNVIFTQKIDDEEILDYYYGIVFDTYDTKINIVDSTTKKLSELDLESKKNVISIQSRISKKPSIL